MHRIILSEAVYRLSKIICSRVKKEWYAFPLGNYKCDRDLCTFFVVDLYVPKQHATVTHVSIPSEDISIFYEYLRDYLQKKGKQVMLGMWHSHGDIGVFHSSEDLANIDRIYQTFTSVLPFAFVGEIPFSIALSKQFSVEPIINDGFRGIKLSFGTASFEMIFGVGIKDKDFFVKWYKYFYDIKFFLEMLENKYGSNPMLKALIKNKIYYVVSVVVNNRNEFDARIFSFEITSSGVKKSSEKAKVEVKKINEKPVLLSMDNIDAVLNRIE